MASSHRWDRPRSLRQSHLGSSAQNELSISDPREHVQGRTGYDDMFKREAFIFRLPDEVLMTIIENTSLYIKPPSVEEHCDCEIQYCYSDMKILALVCRRFNRNVLPLLYHTIRFRKQTIPPGLVVKRLHRSLRMNTSLCQYCRVLFIYTDGIGFSKFQGDDFMVANDLVSWLTSVRCLIISGGFEKTYNKHTWALIQRTVQHMRGLKHFSVDGGCGLSLAPIMMHIDFPLLKKIEIHGIFDATTNRAMLEQKNYRNASFTSISLSNYTVSPQATAQLLQWPIALSHFHFGSSYNSPFYMDLPLFHSMLWVHRYTLKTLSIGYLSYSGLGRLFDASNFPNLEVLELSRLQMDVNLDSPAADANLLLGPNLKKFGWDFTIYDQHSESWDDFGDIEERWVREFARVALAKKTALREIAITFTPADLGQKLEDGYPWDRMDRVCSEVQPCGMLLKYNKPLVTKEAWLAGLLEGGEVWADNSSEGRSSLAPSSPKISSKEPGSSDLEGLELDVLDVQSDESSFMRGGIRGYFYPV